MRFGRVAPSGSQCCDKFFSDRRSVRLSTVLIHDFTHEATYGGIFPCSKVFGCLWMGRHRRRHPGIHSAFVSDLEQAFTLRDLGGIGVFLAKQAENCFHRV